MNDFLPTFIDSCLLIFTDISEPFESILILFYPVRCLEDGHYCESCCDGSARLNCLYLCEN